MAKSDNLVTKGLSGTLDNLTWVNSKAYGDHVRRKRGTVKPAVLNEAMKESKNRLLHVNQIASLIFKCVCHEHKDGKLWPLLLSKLRLQLKDYNYNDVSCLLNLECHRRHTLDKMFHTLWKVELMGIAKRKISIALALPDTPIYNSKYLKEFQLSIHVIFPDFTRSKLKKEVAYCEILYKATCPKEFLFAVPVPADATEFAVFMKVTECEDGKALNYPQSTGMRCVAVGTIEKKQRLEERKVPAKKKPLVKKSVKRKAVNKKKK